MGPGEILSGVLQSLIASRIEYILTALSTMLATYSASCLNLKIAIWKNRALAIVLAVVGTVILTACFLFIYGYYFVGGLRTQLEYFDSRIKLEQRSPIE